GSASCSVYCCTEPANGCRICIGSTSGSCYSQGSFCGRESSFGWVCRGSSSAYFDILHKNRSRIGRDSASTERSWRVWRARFWRRFSISSRAAGTNLTKPARYAGEYLDPLQRTFLGFVELAPQE